jgi:hypothetical protein
MRSANPGPMDQSAAKERIGAPSSVLILTFSESQPIITACWFRVPAAFRSNSMLVVVRRDGFGHSASNHLTSTKPIVENQVFAFLEIFPGRGSLCHG